MFFLPCGHSGLELIYKSETMKPHWPTLTSVELYSAELAHVSCRDY